MSRDEKDSVETGIGETLREAREGQGRAIEDAAAAVRARIVQLKALEDERFDIFGGEVYAKGFLRSYAQYLGLDPEPLIAMFNEQVSSDAGSVSSNLVRPVKTPGPKGTTPPAWAAWVLVGVVVVAGLYFLGLITPGDSPGQATDEVTTPPTPSVPDDDPIVDPGEDAEDQEGDGTNDDADDTSDREERAPEVDEPEIDGVEVILAFEGDSWTRVMVDGVVLLEETVPAGQTLRYDGDEVQVRVGYASRVLVQYNGDDLGSPGGPGEVVELLFTEDGVEDA